MRQTKKSAKKDAMTDQLASLLRKQTPQASSPVSVPVVAPPVVPALALVEEPVAVAQPVVVEKVVVEPKPAPQKASEPAPAGEGSNEARHPAAKSRREEPLIEGVGGGPSMPVTIGINGETRRRLSVIIEDAKESSGIFSINISSALRLCSIIAARAGVTLADVDQMLAEDNRRR